MLGVTFKRSVTIQSVTARLVGRFSAGDTLVFNVDKDRKAKGYTDTDHVWVRDVWRGMSVGWQLASPWPWPREHMHHVHEPSSWKM